MKKGARWPIIVVSLGLGLLGGFYLNSRLEGQAVNNPAIPKDLTTFSPIVKRVVPAVVSIESRGKAQQIQGARPDFPFRDMPGLPEEFKRFFDDIQPQQLPMHEVPSVGFGSGFIVDPKGIILTNYHVVADADQVRVELADGREFFSNEIYGDHKTDLAIVKITPKDDLPFLQLGDSDQMNVGDRVLAVGAPFGLTGSVTHGIISAKGRNLGLNGYEDFLQTDAAINPGNSGGPLVNLEGKVIGINSAIKSRTGGFNGVGMAISSNLARDIKDQLLRNGSVRRGYLGVEIRNLDPDVAERLGVPDKAGVMVSRIMEGGPAAKAGLQPGDVITRIGDERTETMLELQAVVAKHPVNQATELEVVRDGDVKNLDVTIEQQPENLDVRGRSVAPPFSRKAPEEIVLNDLGLTVTDFTPALARKFDFQDPNLQGALITKVEFGSLADQAGLTTNLVVVKVDGKAITSAADFQEAISNADPAKGALILVRSPLGATDFVLLKLPRN